MPDEHTELNSIIMLVKRKLCHVVQCESKSSMAFLGISVFTKTKQGKALCKGRVHVE